MGLLATLKAYSKPEQQQLEWEHKDHFVQPDIKVLKQNIVREVEKDVYSFLAKHINILDNKKKLTATTTRFNIDELPQHRYNNIVNLKNINDARYVNKFFEAINAKLDLGGIYINSVETYATRRHKILGKFIRPFNWFYYVAYVVFMRIFPKLPITKKIYFFITKGRNRVLTRAEAFGRLYSCAFEVIDETEINNKLYFVAKKIKEPAFDDNPSCFL